jgi:hypothetical protein
MRMCFYGAEAALFFLEFFSFGAAGSADAQAFVISECGIGHDAAAIGTFCAFGSMGGFVGPVTGGTPIAAAVAETFFAREIFPALAADFYGGGFFDEGVAAGLCLSIGAEISCVGGLAGKTGAWMVSLGAFSAKGTSTIWANQISGHGIALSRLV